MTHEHTPRVKPIIFSGPMVRALLEGRKTMTRRVLKGNLLGDFDKVFQLDDGSWHHTASDGSHMSPVSVPYARGDLLYVRESWAARLDEDHIRARDLTRSLAFFWADGPAYCCNTGCAGAAGRVRAAMHLPRRLSRLTLEVTDVRVERVQDISEDDAAAEGVELGPSDRPDWGWRGAPGLPDRFHASEAFRDLWDSINEKRGFGWDANPWVVALTFTVHKQNVSDFLKQREAA